MHSKLLSWFIQGSKYKKISKILVLGFYGILENIENIGPKYLFIIIMLCNLTLALGHNYWTPYTMSMSGRHMLVQLLCLQIQWNVCQVDNLNLLVCTMKGMLEKVKHQLHVVCANKVVTIVVLVQIRTWVLGLHDVSLTLYFFFNIYTSSWMI